MKPITLVNFVPKLEDTITIPLGPLYVTSVLEQAGCEVDFRDYQRASHEPPLSQESMADFLSDSHETLGIGCLSNALPFVLLYLQKVKAETPEKTIILGGPGPSAVAEKIVEQFPFIDAVVKGEGERTICDLAKEVPYQYIKGIVYNSNGKAVINPPRNRIDNLDGVPFPAYHRIDFSQYDYAGIITARGCPYSCSFCEVAPLWGYHTERRSISNVISEIRMLHDCGVNSLHIHDDTFVLDRKWVVSFCDTLKAENMDITWQCLGRVNLMDEDLLSEMADAGCVGIQYGIESGSEHVLKVVGKQITVQQIERVIEMSVEYVDDVVSTFMWGFPFESMDDFFETIYLMGVVAEMGSSIKLFFLSPAPLSLLYREYRGYLRFAEEFVSNLLWGVLDRIPHKEKKQVLQMITQNPDIFSSFFYIHTPDVAKKYSVLKEAGLIG